MSNKFAVEIRLISPQKENYSLFPRPYKKKIMLHHFEDFLIISRKENTLRGEFSRFFFFFATIWCKVISCMIKGQSNKNLMWKSRIFFPLYNTWGKKRRVLNNRRAQYSSKWMSEAKEWEAWDWEMFGEGFPGRECEKCFQLGKLLIKSSLNEIMWYWVVKFIYWWKFM